MELDLLGDEGKRLEQMNVGLSFCALLNVILM